MSDFYTAFDRFQSSPTTENLAKFVSHMQILSTTTHDDDMRLWLLEVIKDIRTKDTYKHLRSEECVLQLYSLLANVSRNIGSLGIYLQLEKDGIFATSLRFHLLWATELAKVSELEQFANVLCLARERFKKKLPMSEIECGFRVLGKDYFNNDYAQLFDYENDTMDLFAPPQELCLICGRTTNIANNYGGRCCDTCKHFYKRTVRLYSEITCEKGGQCEITASNTRNCRKCRMDKCFNNGMRRPATIEQEPAISSGTGVEVGEVKNGDEEVDVGEKQDDGNIDEGMAVHVMLDDQLENRRVTNNTYLEFDYDVISEVDKCSAPRIVTSSPANGTRVVAVEDYFHDMTSIQSLAPTVKVDEKRDDGYVLNRVEFNPFDVKLRRQLMRMMDTPQNMHIYKDIGIMALNMIVVSGERFKIQTLIRHGTYSKVYRAISEVGKVVSVSVYQNMSCDWDVYMCHQMRTRLLCKNNETSKRIADRCIMTVFESYYFTNASFLVTEYYGYGTLLEYANNLKEPNWHLSCFLIIQAATIVKEVHDVGIIHGSIKPSSFVITRTIDANWTKDQLLTADCFVLKLIEWDTAIDMEALKGKEFVGKVGTERFDCPEMLDGRQWTYQTDYFGFAAAVAMLLTGKYASLNGSLGQYSLKMEIKRRNELRNVVIQMIDSFLNIRSCSELPGWNQTIDAFSAKWNEKFEAVVWRQCVEQFNQHCNAVKE